MVDQPGAGNSHQFKIRHSRQRHNSKPYQRPSERTKGVIETVTSYLVPSWLQGIFFRGNSEESAQNAFIENNCTENGGEDIPRDNSLIDEATTSGNNNVLPRSSETTTVTTSNGSLSSPTDSNLGRPPLGSFNSVSLTRSFKTSGSNSGPSSTLTQVRENSVCTDGFKRRKTDVRTSLTPIENEVQDHSDVFNSPLFSTPASCIPSRATKKTTAPTPLPFPDSLLATPDVLKASSSRGVNSFLTSTAMRPESNRPPLFPGPPDNERPHSAPLTSSRPSFSLAAFGSVSRAGSGMQPIQERSMFYQGKTVFGGQSTSKRKSTSSFITQPHKVTRRQTKPKVVQARSGSSVTSTTAQKILEQLEHLSSPMMDAKRIPPPMPPRSQSPLSFSPLRTRRKPTSTSTSSSLEARTGGPPIQPLITPQHATISRIHPRRSASPLLSSTVQSKETRKSLNTEKEDAYKLPNASFAMADDLSAPKSMFDGFVPQSLPTSLSPIAGSTLKTGGKMKSARGMGHYSQRSKDDQSAEVNQLPNITSAAPLPIPNGKSLPSFSFPSSATSKTQTTSAFKFTSPVRNSTPSSPQTGFTFSSPSSKQQTPVKQAAVKSPASPQEFSFSKPPPVTNHHKVPEKSVFKFGQDAATKNDKVQKPLDLAKKFAPQAGSWSCDTCMVSNKSSDTSCVACQTPKPGAAPTQAPTSNLSSGFGFGGPAKKAENAGSVKLGATAFSFGQNKPQNDSSKPLFSFGATASTETKVPAFDAIKPGNTTSLVKKFAAPSGSWECEACMINNKGSDESCVACQTPKPTPKPLKTVKTDMTFAKKFAPPTDSWECDTCMVNNNGGDAKCVACATPKPGAHAQPVVGIQLQSDLAKKLAPAAGSWECDSCMLNNKATDMKCIACETPKPGAGSSAVGAFGKSSSSETASSFALKFGAPSSDSSITTSGFKFGAASSDTTSSSKTNPISSSGFKFGTSNAETHTVSKPAFQFGKAGDAKPASSTSFTFGAKPEEKKETSEAKEPSTSGFKFGASSGSDAESSLGPKSIAEAAATGFLKVPPSGESPSSSGKSIADAAKSGFLTVPQTTAAPADSSTNKLPAKSKKRSIDEGELDFSPNVSMVTEGSTPSEAKRMGGTVSSDIGMGGFFSSPFGSGSTLIVPPTSTPSFSFSSVPKSDVPSTSGAQPTIVASSSAAVPMPTSFTFSAAPKTNEGALGFKDSLVRADVGFSATPSTGTQVSTASTFGGFGGFSGFKSSTPSSGQSSLTSTSLTATSVATSASTTNSSPFVFGSAASVAPVPSVTSQSQSQAGGFNFSMNKPAETATGVFRFASSTPANTGNTASTEDMDSDNGASSATVPLFGAGFGNQNAQAAGVFGGSSAAAPAMFGASNATTPFKFSPAVNNPTQSAAPAFSFQGSGSNSTGAFNFGGAAASAPAQPGAGVFQFGQVAPTATANPTPTGGFNFSGAPAPTNSGMAFGQSTQNTAAFSFNAAPTASASAPFQFGAAPQAPPAFGQPQQGGFNFSGAGQPTAAFAFNAAASPAGGQPNMFTAGLNSADGSRKFKRAVRRKR